MLRCQRLNFNSQTVLRSTGLLETAEQTATVEANETALEHGSGLGLWLVYWLAEKSEADLEFDDSKRGGSAVSIIFRTPAADNPRLEAAAERETDSEDADGTDGETK
jgi:cell division inhibitor SulA